MSGTFDFIAALDGVYRTCFSNPHSSDAYATAKIRAGDAPDLIQLAKTEHLTPLEVGHPACARVLHPGFSPLLQLARYCLYNHTHALYGILPDLFLQERIKDLHESMNAVRDLQDQIREQDEAQATMTRSTRAWLLYFTLFEAMVLVGVTAWQNLVRALAHCVKPSHAGADLMRACMHVCVPHEH